MIQGALYKHVTAIDSAIYVLHSFYSRDPLGYQVTCRWVSRSRHDIYRDIGVTGEIFIRGGNEYDWIKVEDYEKS